MYEQFHLLTIVIDSFVDIADNVLMHADIQTISVSEFKATCLSVLKRLKLTGKSLLITRHGEVIAEVGPPRTLKRQESWLGKLSNSGKITGDLVSPASDLADWNVLRDEK